LGGGGERAKIYEGGWRPLVGGGGDGATVNNNGRQ
jgi:hypothetical protein